MGNLQPQGKPLQTLKVFMLLWSLGTANLPTFPPLQFAQHSKRLEADRLSLPWLHATGLNYNHVSVSDSEFHPGGQTRIRARTVLLRGDRVVNDFAAQSRIDVGQCCCNKLARADHNIGPSPSSPPVQPTTPIRRHVKPESQRDARSPNGRPKYCLWPLHVAEHDVKGPKAQKLGQLSPRSPNTKGLSCPHRTQAMQRNTGRLKFLAQPSFETDREFRLHR